MNIIQLKFILLPVIIFILVSVNSFSQTDSSYLKTEEVLEDVLQEIPGEIDNSDLYDIIEQLKRNPVNLNTATIADLQQIPGMDLSSAKLIINHRNQYGDFFSISELNTVQNLDKKLISLISPFLYVSKRKENVTEKEMPVIKNIVNNIGAVLRSRLANDLQTRKGFIEGKFEGTKPKVYNRLLVNYNKNFQAGFLSEKDAGESSLSEFTTYHFAVQNFGIIHKAVLMDYILEFGQGLTMWSPFGFSKGSDAVYPVKRKDKIIKPYTSSTENNFFRGAAASIKIKSFFLSGFYSNNYFDANIDTLTGEILSTPEDGLHRTTIESKKRKSAAEKMWGARLDYFDGSMLKAGIMYYQSTFSNKFQPGSVYDLKGDNFNYTSFYYDLYFLSFNVFGEVVYNGTSVASINSMQLSVTRDLNLIASIRSYPRNFISLHGFGFGERNGATSNEFGIYTGLKWRTPFGLLNFYYDQFKFPYATFSNPLPSDGDEYLVDFLSKPFHKFETRVRYKYENKDVTQIINNTPAIVKRLKQALRAELIFSIANKLRLKGRFEYNSFKISKTNSDESGYLIFQDLRYSPSNNFNFYGRIIFFRTDSFNSAIYEFENNLTGVLTNLALFGEGIRWYVLVRYRPLRFISLSVKYSETYKPREEKIGSGDAQINGNLDNRIGIQLDINL